MKRTVGDTPGEEVGTVREPVPVESLEHRMSIWRGQQEGDYHPCWSCSVPGGQCLVREWLGPSTIGCSHTYTADLPCYSQKPQKSPFLLQCPVLFNKEMLKVIPSIITEHIFEGEFGA